MSLLLSIMLLHFLAQMTPGPDVLLISRLAITQGRTVAIYAIAGITLGIAVWIVLTLTGFGLLLQQWQWFQPLIMGFGAIFLTKMGWGMLSGAIAQFKQTKNANHDEYTQPMETHYSHTHYLMQGLITNLINPKALIYFASVFSLAVNSAELQQMKWILAIVIIIETFLVFVLLAFILSNKKIKPYYQNYSHYIDGTAGVLFIGFAGYLVWQIIHFLYSI